MFVFKENGQDILLITVDYPSVLLISFIFSTKGIFSKKRMRLNGNGIALKSCSAQKNGTGMAPKSILLMSAPAYCSEM
jgi:hypothetical protein